LVGQCLAGNLGWQREVTRSRYLPQRRAQPLDLYRLAVDLQLLSGYEWIRHCGSPSLRNVSSLTSTNGTGRCNSLTNLAMASRSPLQSVHLRLISSSPSPVRSANVNCNAASASVRFAIASGVTSGTTVGLVTTVVGIGLSQSIPDGFCLSASNRCCISQSLCIAARDSSSVSTGALTPAFASPSS